MQRQAALDAQKDKNHVKRLGYQLFQVMNVQLLCPRAARHTKRPDLRQLNPYKSLFQHGLQETAIQIVN